MKETTYRCDLCGRQQIDPERKMFNFGLKGSGGPYIVVPLKQKLIYCKKQICRECIEIIKEAKI